MAEQWAHTLYDLLQRRPRPERVTEVLEQVLPLSDKELLTFRRSAGQYRSQWWTYSSMQEDFRRPENKVERQVDLLPVLFGVTQNIFDQYAAPAHVDTFVEEQVQRLGAVGRRMPKAERRRRGIYKSAKWFNKRRRLLKAVRQKRFALQMQEELYLFERIAKAALSVEIPLELFAQDLNTAALVTYLSALMNRRSQFTNQSQDRAFDTVAKFLMDRCRRSETTNWFVIAHLMSDQEVLAHLTGEQKGMLVGRLHTLLSRMAERLEVIHQTANFSRETMIVRRGTDSSTWNAIAGAWNKARELWVSMLHAQGMDAILEVVCPGKVMRLMAADVADWHSASGGQIHPDTAVWADLPAPWEVLKGQKPCGLREIQFACDAAGANFETWTFRRDRPVVQVKPTPELVHGVTVAAPELAAQLRKAGVFSGKSIKGPLPDFTVHRDEHEAAIGVSSGSSNRAGGSAFRQDGV